MKTNFAKLSYSVEDMLQLAEEEDINITKTEARDILQAFEEIILEETTNAGFEVIKKLLRKHDSEDFKS